MAIIKDKVNRQPDYHPIVDFMRGQSSIIMRDVEESDGVVLVTRRGKPMAAIISYEKYKKLAETGSLDDAGSKIKVEKN